MLNSGISNSSYLQAAAQANSFRNFALQQQALLQAQMRAQLMPGSQFPNPPSQGPAPGSLIIHDTFELSSNSPYTGEGNGGYWNKGVNKNSKHGEIVRYSAEFDGFQGPVVERQTSSASDPYFSRIQHQSASALKSQNLTKEQANQALRNQMGAFTEGLYDTQTRMLNQDTASGARNSVVNISRGTSKARLTGDTYTALLKGVQSKDPQENKEGFTALGNYARAFDLDMTKLTSTDPEIHGPERQKLMQGLADTASSVIDHSPRIAQARQKFDSAVSRFEEGNNSVVIAAGNEGRVGDLLAKLNHGRRLDLPDDFTKNILENDQVTTVGATRWKYDGEGNLKESKAGYSSHSDGIDIYASGSVGFKDPNKKETDGTSYSAPRVASAMAELHRQNPNMSSAQIEALMKSKLTHQLPQGSPGEKVLDFGKSFAFLKGQKF